MGYPTLNAANHTFTDSRGNTYGTGAGTGYQDLTYGTPAYNEYANASAADWSKSAPGLLNTQNIQNAQQNMNQTTADYYAANPEDSTARTGAMSQLASAQAAPNVNANYQPQFQQNLLRSLSTPQFQMPQSQGFSFGGQQQNWNQTPSSSMTQPGGMTGQWNQGGQRAIEGQGFRPPSSQFGYNPQPNNPQPPNYMNNMYAQRPFRGLLGS